MVSPPPIELGNLGMADSLILMVLALVVFGPRRLPQIGRQIGKLMYEFRKASNDFKFQMEEELRLSEEADRRKKEEEERARNLALTPPAPATEAHAAIGADEQASVAAPAGLYSGDFAAPAAAETPTEPATEPVAEPAAAQEELHIHYPRINPPASGEPVPAARPGATSVLPQPSPDGGVMEEANIGAAPAEAAEPTADAEPAKADPDAGQPGQPSEPTQTEPVTHHG